MQTRTEKTPDGDKIYITGIATSDVRRGDFCEFQVYGKCNMKIRPMPNQKRVKPIHCGYGDDEWFYLDCLATTRQWCNNCQHYKGGKKCKKKVKRM